MKESVGLPHVLLCSLAPLTPFFFSGAVRYQTRLEMGPALVIASVALGLVALFGTVRLRARFSWERQAGTVALVLLAVGLALSAWGFYDRWFEGMPSVGGGDAGLQLQARGVFVSGDPIFYHGFNSFYSYTHWAGRLLGLDAFESFRFGFYTVPWVFWISLAAAAAVTVRRVGEGAAGRLAATLLLSGTTALAIVLPLIHYYQADGFFSILFGIAPVICAWACYGVAERSATRLAILIVWLVADRFTYGLNLGDTLLSMAVLVAWEAARWPRIARWLAVLGTLGLVAAAALFWVKLARFVEPEGRIVLTRTVPLLVGEFILSVWMLLLPGCARDGLRSPLGRLVLFAGVNGLLNVAGQLAWLASPLPGGYYLQRYHLHSVVLLAGASAVLGPVALSQVPRSRRSLARIYAGVLLGSLLCLGFAFPGQQDSYLERILGGPPWRRLKPLADRAGIQNIARVLTAERKPCLAVLAPSWAMANFMNAATGTLYRWYQLPYTPLELRDGCVFWYGSENDIEAMGRYALRGGSWSTTPLAIGETSQRLARQLEGDPHRYCEEYRALWEPSRTLRLCHVCF